MRRALALSIVLAVWLASPPALAADAPRPVIVTVSVSSSSGQPAQGVVVRFGAGAATTDATGIARIRIAPAPGFARLIVSTGGHVRGTAILYGTPRRIRVILPGTRWPAGTLRASR
jgi:hypothetical protein